jgi:hypothetical protein
MAISSFDVDQELDATIKASGTGASEVIKLTIVPPRRSVSEQTALARAGVPSSSCIGAVFHRREKRPTLIWINR